MSNVWKSDNENPNKKLEVQESSVAPFKFIFGGRHIRTSVYVAASLFLALLYLLFSYILDGTRENSRPNPIVIWSIFLIFTPLFGFISYRNIRGLIRRDPTVAFDGNDIFVIIGDRQHRCIDSNWYDLKEPERFERGYVCMHLDPKPSFRDVILRGTALKGPGSHGNVCIWSRAFIEGDRNFRTKVSTALNVLDLRNNGREK